MQTQTMMPTWTLKVEGSLEALIELTTLIDRTTISIISTVKEQNSATLTIASLKEEPLANLIPQIQNPSLKIGKIVSAQKRRAWVRVFF